jgi:uncharacterized protein (DUF1330 family)
MNSNRKLAIAVLAGAAIGAAATSALHAQQAKPLPGFVVAEVEITDPATYQKYAQQVVPTLEPFGGHFLVRGGKILPVEGPVPSRVAIIAFDSAEKAKAWEDSPAYSVIRPIRQSAAKSRIFIVEGLPAQ